MNDIYMNSEDEEISMFAVRGDLDGGKDTQTFDDIKQFIGFVIGTEEFLLPIEVMNEIIMVHQLTYVPGAPPYIEGVINLRGKILPAINLRKMMGHQTIAPTMQSRIIIAHFEDQVVGLIVDGITYVVSLQPVEVQNQSLPGKGRGTELVSAIAKKQDKVMGIVDISKIVAETGFDPNRRDDSDAEAS